jgi:hypothetical protein
VYTLCALDYSSMTDLIFCLHALLLLFSCCCAGLDAA